MVPFSLFLALKYLKPKRSVLSVVTVIAVIGVMLGVAALIIVNSVMNGFGNMWKQKILSFKPHVTVVGQRGGIEQEESLCRAIEQIPGVTGVGPVVVTRTLMRYENRIATPVVIGVDPLRAGKISRAPQQTFPTFDVENEGVVLGRDLADRLAVAPGNKLLIYSPRNVMANDEMYLPVEVVARGVFDMGMRDYDGEFVFASLDVARSLAGLIRGAHALHIVATDPMNTDALTDRIRKTIGSGYAIRTWREEDRVLFDALATEKVMMLILLGLVALVGIFCVTCVLIIVAYQKTNEIGLLKALGFSSLRIMATFVLYGWIQCLAGILAGLGLAFLVLHNLTGIARGLACYGLLVFPKAIYGLSEIPWETSAIEVEAIVLGVLFAGTLASLIPAWRAARLDPVEALRNE
ncbi:MAG: ABC transporter permease [Verrucomicrobiota bacterium]|nr:ABC transporter permease [Verrucomicrobiota bacterium]